MLIHVAKPQSEVARIFKAAYPAYAGKKFKIDVRERVQIPNCYWDGGSKESAVFVKLDDLTQLDIGTNHPFFENNPAQAGAVIDLPPGLAMVVHSWFCGKDMGLTLYVNPVAVNPLQLAAPAPELTLEEKRCLYATRAFKSSYGGNPNYRRNQSGLSQVAWDSAKASLTTKGLLDKRGAITADGRNVARDWWSLPSDEAPKEISAE